MKIKRMKKGKKLQVSNVSAPALLLLPDKKRNKTRNKIGNKKKNKNLYSKFSLSSLISVQTGFIWVLEFYCGILQDWKVLENYNKSWQSVKIRSIHKAK